MSNSTQLTNLFANAVAAGTITSTTSTLLSGHLGAVVVAGAAGLDAENIQASDVTLVTVLIDASSSIADRGLEQAVREGQHALLDAFAGSKERDGLLVALWTFNQQARVVHAYLPVPDAVRLDASNYRGGGSTALYDTWCDALAANLAYAQQLRDSGTPCRSVVVVITDGEDVGSSRRAPDCAQLSRDLLASEQFVLAFVGVGGSTDFRAVARSMGIPDGCITVQSSATAQGLRKVFQMVSQSAIRVSQGMIQPGAQAGFFTP
ncbi:MAG: VWA domain-containing protein [Deltaproteobacteria bacterium]|nr:VWA domain-containing protein [Deltaproteobacteria bacterium]